MLESIKTKLVGLPPIYYINLDHRDDKRKHMERLVAEYDLKATRVSAVDGRKHVGDYVKEIPPAVKHRELACSISHLNTIRKWLTESDTPYALICEDDWSLDTVMYWSFTWNDFTSRLPYYWDIVQCCITYHPQMTSTLNLHLRELGDFACVSYLINRRYAMKLMDLYWKNNRWDIVYPSPFKLTAEELLYKPGVCFSIPLFTYTNEFESSIQTLEHMAKYHIPARQFTLESWLKMGKNDLLSMYPLVQIKK